MCFIMWSVTKRQTQLHALSPCWQLYSWRGITTTIYADDEPWVRGGGKQTGWKTTSVPSPGPSIKLRPALMQDPLDNCLNPAIFLVLFGSSQANWMSIHLDSQCLWLDDPFIFMLDAFHVATLLIYPGWNTHWVTLECMVVACST